MDHGAKIDSIPTFDKRSAADAMAAKWPWLGVEAAESLLDFLAPYIQSAIDGTTE
jgi:hypothetical protein